jgi:hypothetical protein
MVKYKLEIQGRKYEIEADERLLRELGKLFEGLNIKQILAILVNITHEQENEQ